MISIPSKGSSVSLRICQESQPGLSLCSYRIAVYRWSCRTARNYKQPGAIIHFSMWAHCDKAYKSLFTNVSKPLSQPFSIPDEKWHTLCACLQNYSALNQHIVNTKATGYKNVLQRAAVWPWDQPGHAKARTRQSVLVVELWMSVSGRGGVKGLDQD